MGYLTQVPDAVILLICEATVVVNNAVKMKSNDFFLNIFLESIIDYNNNLICDLTKRNKNKKKKKNTKKKSKIKIQRKLVKI